MMGISEGEFSSVLELHSMNVKTDDGGIFLMEIELLQ